MNVVKKGKLRIEHPFIAPFSVVVERQGFQIQEPAKNGHDWVDWGTVLQQKNHVLFYLKQLVLSEQEGNINPGQFAAMEKHVEQGLDQLFSAPIELPTPEEIVADGEKIEEDLSGEDLSGEGQVEVISEVKE